MFEESRGCKFGSGWSKVVYYVEGNVFVLCRADCGVNSARIFSRSRKSNSRFFKSRKCFTYSGKRTGDFYIT